MKKFNPYPWLILFFLLWGVTSLIFYLYSGELTMFGIGLSGLFAFFEIGMFSIGTESFDQDKAIINELDCGDEEY